MRRLALVVVLTCGAVTAASPASGAVYRNRQDLMLLLSVRRDEPQYRDFLLRMRALQDASLRYRTDPSLHERINYSKDGMIISRTPISYDRYIEDKDATLATLGALTPRNVYEAISEVAPIPGVGRYLLPDDNLLYLTEQGQAADPAAMIKQIELASSDPVIMEHVRKAFKAEFGVDLNSDLTTPTDVAAAKARLDTLKLGNDVNAMQSAIAANGAAVSGLASKLQQLEEEEQAAKVTAQEAENRRKKIIREGEDAAASLRLVGFVADATGNGKLAQFAFGAADRVSGIFDLLSRESEMSNFAFSVSMFYQVNGIAALVNTGTEPAEVQMLRALMDQISALRSEMVARFENLTEFVGAFWRDADAHFATIEGLLQQGRQLDEAQKANLAIEFESVNTILVKGYGQQFVLAEEARRNSQAAEYLKVAVEAENLKSSHSQAVKPLIEKLNARIVTLAEQLNGPPFVVPATAAADPARAKDALIGTGNIYVPAGIFAAGANVFDELASADALMSPSGLPINIGAWLDLSRTYRQVARSRGREWFAGSRISDTDRLIAVGNRTKLFIDNVMSKRRAEFWAGAIKAFKVSRDNYVAALEQNLRQHTQADSFGGFDEARDFAAVEADEKALPYVGSAKKAHYCSNYGFFDPSGPTSKLWALDAAEVIRWNKAEFPLPQNVSSIIPWELRLAERTLLRQHPEYSIDWCINPSQFEWKAGDPKYFPNFILMGTVKTSVWDSPYPETINRLQVGSYQDDRQVEPGRMIVAVAIIPHAEALAWDGLGTDNWQAKQKTIDRIWQKSIDAMPKDDNLVWALDGRIDAFKRETNPHAPGSLQQRGFDERDAARQFLERCVLASRAKLDSPEEQAFCAANRTGAGYLYSSPLSVGKYLSSPTVFEQDELRKKTLELLKNEYATERLNAIQALSHDADNPTLVALGEQITVAAIMLRAACEFAFVETCLTDKAVQAALFKDGPLDGLPSAQAYIKDGRRLDDPSFFAKFNDDTKSTVDALTAASTKLLKSDVPNPVYEELSRLADIKRQQQYWQRKAK